MNDYGLTLIKNKYPMAEGKLGIRPMMPDDIAKVVAFEEERKQLPQVPFTMHHTLHAGMYARTMKMPANTVLTGALIKIATILIVSGNAAIYAGENQDPIHVNNDYAVIPASANRKQAIRAYEDTHLTMLFPTTATTVEEAENQFTDEANELGSRKPDADNIIVQTGD